MPYVREYREKDRESLRSICVQTSLMSTETKRDRAFLYYMYNDYYTEFEPESCFVLADDNDEAVGYVLCAKDYETYIDAMQKYYLPRIENLGLKFFVMARGANTIHKLYRHKYPTHLHIDILPEFQGMGYGTQLINRLKKHLVEMGIKSVMLGVGSTNKGAVKFYKKNGFKKVATLFGSLVMVADTN